MPVAWSFGSLIALSRHSVNLPFVVQVAFREIMAKHKFDKYNLNLAGEFRVASELLLRGLYASVTFGNKKGADILAVGANRVSAVIEVKASQTPRFVTGYYQKYKTADGLAPDFGVLYSVQRTDNCFAERFFVLSHAEMGTVQGERNAPGEQLTYDEHVIRVSQGVDNVKRTDVESFENQLGEDCLVLQSAT